MTENEPQTKAITKTKNSQGYRSFGRVDDEKPVSRYTFFIIAVLALFAGGWAISCLVKAATNVGPLSLLKQLTSALFNR